MERLCRNRSGISVMFMTFIAVSILSLIFISYYLYLTQHNLSASEAQRIYAEAAQENLEVILDRRGGEVLVNNTGGIGVVIKYLVGLDSSGGAADIREPPSPIPVPVGASIALKDGQGGISFPGGELYVMTERGNMFRAVPGGYKFEIEAEPSSISLGRGGSAVVTLKLKAILLETPEQGVILVVADPSGCRMTTTTTRTQIVSITHSTTAIIGGTTVQTAIIYYWIFPIATITYIAGPTTMTVINSVSAVYMTETVTRTEEWIETPEPITIAFTTKTKTAITAPVTINARALNFWDETAGCFIWFKVLNATSGSRLAEAGIRAAAGTTTETITTTTVTTTMTTTTATTTTQMGYVEIDIVEDIVSGGFNDEKTVTINVISRYGYSGTVTLSYQEEPQPPSDDVIFVPSGAGWGFTPSNTVTLSPGETETVTFRFRIRGSGTVTITGTASPEAYVDPDEFIVTMTP